ncbi:MAG: putative Zn-dependent protease [Planctomycetota bacterium]|jgi:predicted Zn-dependent protease
MTLIRGFLTAAKWQASTRPLYNLPKAHCAPRRRGYNRAMTLALAPWILSLSLSALPYGISPSTTGLLSSSGLPADSTSTRVDDLDDELEELLAEERDEADRLRRRGRIAEARRLLTVHLDDDPDDWRSRAQRALCYRDEGDWDRAESELLRALDAGQNGDAPAQELQLLQMDLAESLIQRGRADEALERLFAGDSGLKPIEPARQGYLAGMANLELGDRQAARDAFQSVVFLGAERMDWKQLLYRAKCEHAIGQLESATESLVAADALAAAGAGIEASVLVELADIYFEADGEVAKSGSSSRLPSALYREALELNPNHAGALLGQYELHKLNWRRNRSARSFLEELLNATPESMDGLLALTHSHLEQGELVAARKRLAKLEQLAPNRRDVRALRACLRYIEDKPKETQAVLAELAKSAPWDSSPERRLGTILVALYRFADALPFLEAAILRDPADWRALSLLGEALANTGDEKRALEMLVRSEDLAEGRQDAWRNNMKLVLGRIAGFASTTGPGELSYAWPAEGSEVLERVLPAFYAESREDLSARYGFTPGPTLIEVFDRHRDFSVRSTGFEGFPALGVCFGPVVTALSPNCEMRGQFSWAETSYHEFSHVIHLGLTSNRCPRWITEGLATWEEEQRDRSWIRPLRRELVDSFASNRIIGVRDLNRAFSGPRIIWAYYQGGLMCDLMIDDYGFPAMVRLLEAFNEGKDLDGALDAAYGLTPEQLDALFLERVEQLVVDLHVEPRHDPNGIRLMRLGLERSAPSDSAELAAWSQDWCSVAWSAWQGGRSLDAEEALRVLGDLRDELPRALFLRAEIALRGGDVEEAEALYRSGFERGGEDYRARMALANLALRSGKRAEVESLLLAAEHAFPGWEDASFSAELHLVDFYKDEEETDKAMAALERWLAWNSGEDVRRLEVANWQLDRGDYEGALKMFTSAVEVDPFRASAHQGQGEALLALKRFDEAAYALETALLVPVHLDADWGAAGGQPVDDERLAAVSEQALLVREAMEGLLERARAGGAAVPE